MAERVGIIGIGNMGRFYLQKMVQAGYSVAAFDTNSSLTAWAQEHGAETASSPAEVAQKSGVLVLAVPGNREVEQVMDGREGVLAHLASGQVVVNTSTTHPDLDRRYALLCDQRGAGWLDAPVTWRAQGLIVMVGGDERFYQRVLPVLQSFAYRVVHVGETGAGQRLKAVNQMILANQLAVWCEAAEFARSIGLSPEAIRDVLEMDIPQAVLGNEFAGGGQLSLHYKDLGYILELAHTHMASVPLTSFVHEVFKATAQFGGTDWIQPGIVTFWRRLNRPEAADG